MPIYQLRNRITGEEWEEILSFAAREERLKDPDIEQVITTVAFVSGISGVTHKNDSGFNEMMQRVAASNPTTPMAEKYGDKGIKATKTREAVRKQKARQTFQ